MKKLILCFSLLLLSLSGCKEINPGFDYSNFTNDKARNIIEFDQALNPNGNYIEHEITSSSESIIINGSCDSSTSIIDVFYLNEASPITFDNSPSINDSCSNNGDFNMIFNLPIFLQGELTVGSPVEVFIEAQDADGTTQHLKIIVRKAPTI